MSIVHSTKQVGLALLLVALSVLSVTLVTSMRPVSAAPTGTYFDHIVIIAMENTAYASVFGSGTVSSCPTSSAPFLCGMLPLGSTLPSYNSYGATAADTNDFNGCSAACYVGFMLGSTYGISDGYSFSSVSGNPQLVTSLASAGLTWQAYCESGCPDRKSTRLNSSHVAISYAVFCLKKKKKTINETKLRPQLPTTAVAELRVESETARTARITRASTIQHTVDVLLGEPVASAPR